VQVVEALVVLLQAAQVVLAVVVMELVLTLVILGPQTLVEVVVVLEALAVRLVLEVLVVLE
jgi:hypothetical protein